ncbi:MAG: sigma-70 family RNA polymerase sigma factor [Bacteroidales bacterium]|nr:sigma-70 family RNA polymerase sigma factor [Bacteroidales bacterium]
MEKHTDIDILNLFENEETKDFAFTVLVRNYQKQIYFLIRRMVINHEDANDLTQDTFIKVWQNLSAFKQQSKLFTWIYKIAVNVTITFLNNKKKFLFIPFVDIESNLSNNLINDPFFNGDSIQLKLQKAILTLPQKQRLVFNMKYYDELKYEEISEILGTSVGALKASYHLAVKKIEKYISEN